MTTPPSIYGIYRHYKGNEYEVIGEGLHTETEERLVIYKAIHPPFTTWIRPYEMFFGTVVVDGFEKPRFERTGDT